MRTWSIELSPNRSFTLSADCRLTQTDYCNDHIWELSCGSGEPGGLYLETTFGLRARNFRLFPRFFEYDKEYSNPQQFIERPKICKFFPNFIEVAFTPLECIDVLAEYWVPSSYAVVGRMRFRNQGNVSRKIRFEWVAQLIPFEEGGQYMAPHEIQATQVLCGSSGGLFPVVFLNTGPVAVFGPYAALSLVLDLPVDASRTVIWSEAALGTPQESFQLARTVALKNLDAERARIEIINAGQLEIHTGEPEWDLAFALSQNTAFRLFMSATKHLPCSSFVINRRPEQGYSHIGSGSDYDHLWSGQSPLEAYYLARLVLPSGVDLVKGILDNFLSTQQPDGLVDLKPGLGGQRSKHLATPLLSFIAWQIYQITQDHRLLEKTYPKLFSFFHSWFSSEHDRDEDGFPEWDDPLQLGFVDHPIFARWHLQSHGIDISTVESPALGALLYKECQILIRMAQILSRTEDFSILQSRLERLRQSIEETWNQKQGCYLYRDRDLHISTNSENIGLLHGPGILNLHKRIKSPSRLVIRILTTSEATRRVRVFIHGTTSTGKHKVEQISSDRFLWFPGIGTATSEQTYEELEHIEVIGCSTQDQVLIESARLNIRDLSLLLPLWSGVPSNERAAQLLQSITSLHHGFLKPYGLASFPDHLGDDDYNYHTINMILNDMIGEGMLRYGFIIEASEIITRLMSAVVKNIAKEGGFRRYYHQENGEGIGERDSLWGLAPLGLFLDLIGVRIFTPFRVALFGSNPFPWPVTIKYRGLIVKRIRNETVLTFPDGQMLSFNDPTPIIVNLE